MWNIKLLAFFAMIFTAWGLDLKYLPPKADKVSFDIDLLPSKQEFSKSILSTELRPIQTVSSNKPSPTIKDFFSFSAPESKRVAEFKLPGGNVVQRTIRRKTQNIVIIKGQPKTKKVESQRIFPVVPTATDVNPTNPQIDLRMFLGPGKQVSSRNLIPSRSVSNAPIVHFLKYRNEDEAKQLQENILKQYGFSEAERRTPGSIQDAPNVHFIGFGSKNSPGNTRISWKTNDDSIGKNYERSFVSRNRDVSPGTPYLPVV